LTRCTDVHILFLVTVEWDAVKARSNRRKYGVDFTDAAVALEDELAFTIEDTLSRGEQRFVTLCCDPHGRVIVVVFTLRGDTVRIISARKATGRERKVYEE
jgi:uncharacterized DUF497 family protein